MSLVQRRTRQLQDEFSLYRELTAEVQHELLEELLPELTSQEGWASKSLEMAKAVVNDAGHVFRMLRRAKFSVKRALELLQLDLVWRISTAAVDSLSLFSLAESQYKKSGLFFFLPEECEDICGRPISVISLSQVARSSSGSLDGLKEFVLWAFEATRRYALHLSNRNGTPVLSFSVIIDANATSYQNLEVELLPFLHSIGHEHYPGLFGTFIVVNYSWTSSGLWTLVKQILPSSALNRIKFTSKPEELKAFFDLELLPEKYGGKVPFKFNHRYNSWMMEFGKSSEDKMTTSQPLSSTWNNLTISTQAPLRTSSWGNLAASFVGLGGKGRFEEPVSPTTTSTSASTIKPGKARDRFPGFSMTSLKEKAADDSKFGVGRSEKCDPHVSASSTTATIRPSLPSLKIRHSSSSIPLSSTTFKLQLPPQAPVKNFAMVTTPDSIYSEAATTDGGYFPTKLPASLPSPSSEPSTSRSTDAKLSPILHQPSPSSHLRRFSSSIGKPTPVNPESAKVYAKTMRHLHAESLSRTASPNARELAAALHRLDSGALQQALPISTPTSSRSLATNTTRSTITSQPTPVVDEMAPFDPSNSFFGYPAPIVVDSSGRRRVQYGRRRMRDLVKTLLFLFFLRIQAFRDRIFSYFSLGWVVGLAGSAGASSTYPIASTSHSRALRKGAVGDNIKVLLFSLLLLRGFWTRLVPSDNPVLGGALGVLDAATTYFGGGVA